MSFKVHLMIIFGIVVFTYIILQLMQTAPPPQQVTPEDTSPYKISILHATWGLNCLNSYDTTYSEDVPNAFGSTSKRIWFEDNILSKVQDLCNNKKTCVIPNTKEALGALGEGRCDNREIKVEYRCFSFDRPWIVTAKDRDKELVIDCEKQNESNG